MTVTNTYTCPSCCNPPITTACCPSDPTSQFLFATVGGGGGSYQLVYNASESAIAGCPVWNYYGTLGTCANGLEKIRVACPFPTWTLTINRLTPYSPASSTCNSYSVVFNNVDLTACGFVGLRTLTVTP